MPPLPGYRPATSWVHYITNCNTRSSAPEDGRNHRPKHVELNGIVNKPLLLHLVGCLYYCINDARSNKYQICILMLLSKVKESTCRMEDMPESTVGQEIDSQKGISLWLHCALQHQPDHVLRTLKFETILYCAVSVHFRLFLFA